MTFDTLCFMSEKWGYSITPPKKKPRPRHLNPALLHNPAHFFNPATFNPACIDILAIYIYKKGLSDKKYCILSPIYKCMVSYDYFVNPLVSSSDHQGLMG